MMSASAATDPTLVIQSLMAGSHIAHMIRATVDIGLADHLGDKLLDAQALAEATSTHAPSLNRLLRALAAVGIVEETDNQLYQLTPLGEVLRTNAPNSMRGTVLFLSDAQVEQPWTAIAHSVRTGEVAFRHIFGTDQFSYLSTHRESAVIFDGAMREITRGVNVALLKSYPFDTFKWIMDVGGGTGSLLIPILEANPNMRGSVFELPQVARQARERVAASSVASRCDVLDGDATQSVPSGADAYVFKSVLHMHGDDNAVKILRNCRSAMASGGKVILIERLLPDQVKAGNEVANLMLDMTMMALNGGRERTEQDFASLFKRSSLRLYCTHRTSIQYAIIEAVAN
jgi:orsellinic acid C2-O-methyltransferase